MGSLLISTLSDSVRQLSLLPGIICSTLKLRPRANIGQLQNSNDSIPIYQQSVAVLVHSLYSTEVATFLLKDENRKSAGRCSTIRTLSGYPRTYIQPIKVDIYQRCNSSAGYHGRDISLILELLISVGKAKRCSHPPNQKLSTIPGPKITHHGSRLLKPSSQCPKLPSPTAAPTI